MPLPLTSKQRARLRGLGHKLTPLVHVGKEGVSSNLIESVEQTLTKRELIKIRVQDHAPDGTRDTAQAIAKAIEGSSVVHVVGHTALIFRPDPEVSEIKLPDESINSR